MIKEDLIDRLEREIIFAKANGNFDYIFAISVSDAIALVELLKDDASS